jgi:crotonobetaine/carnitine-CoA ligase
MTMTQKESMQKAMLVTPLEVLNQFEAHNYTLTAAFESRLKANPDKVFCFFDGKEHTWAEFDRDVRKMAAFLRAKQIQAGDRVGIIAKNHYAHLLLLFSLARLSAILLPINPEFGAAELGYVLNNSEPKLLFIESDLLEVVKVACNENDLSPIITFLDQPQNSERHPQHQNIDEILSHSESFKSDPSNAQADDTCVIIYTSGTTGFPKGVMHSQRSFLLCGEAYIERLYIQSDDRIMVVLPLFHMNALFYSVAGALCAGATLAVMPRFSASQFWRQAVESKATTVNLIEAACNILKLRPRSEFHAEHQIRCAYGVRHSAHDVFLNEFHIPYFVSGYGMTEIPGVTCSPFGGLQKPGTMGPIGKHPNPHQVWAECRVIDEAGDDVPNGVTGEMIVKTPIIMQGYFRDPEQTRSSFKDGWFLTGDLVNRDEDGYYTFVSRKKDIIRRRGENISGAELDRIISTHPNVAEVAAIAVPAELGEDEILAAIVLKPNTSTSPQEIQTWCAQHLAPMKVPRYIVFMDALPYTPTQKISKAVLRADKGLIAKAVDLLKPNPTDHGLKH